MRIVKHETQVGVLQTITFQREGEEVIAFKQAIKVWITANAPMTWEEFFEKAERVDNNSVILRMT